MLRPILFACVLLVPALSVRGESPDPRLKGYRVAPGFKAEIAATEPLVINPVSMTFGDDGRLFVIEWVSGDGPNDRIKVLTDTDGDGVFDKSAIYMDGLELPAGLLFWDGWTYLTLNHDVVRFKDADGDGTFETRQSIATGFGNDNSHHRVSGLTMGPDGWIYITTGDSDAHAKGSDGSTATVLRCGGVFRCKPDGSHMENVAFGMRNPFGNVAFDDEFNIFHTDNDNEGSPGFTGCRILHVVEGGDYGWRLREGARCCQPDFERATWNGGRPGRLGWVAETGRGAPAGLCILNSAAFPASTRNLLVYPDVFRKTVRAYGLKPVGATFTVDHEFELLAADDPLFRPDDAEIGPDGALYVLDWRTDSGGAGKLSGNGQFGRIYRLTWSGTDKEPALPTFPRDRYAKLVHSRRDGLVEAFSSKDYGMRRTAGLELIRRASHIDFIAEDPELFDVHMSFAAHSRELSSFARSKTRILVARRQSLAVLMAYGSIEKESPWRGQIGTIMADTSLHRLSYEYLSRFGRGDDRYEAYEALMASDASMTRDRPPQVLRAIAVALGRFSEVDSDKAGSEFDLAKAFSAISRESLTNRQWFDEQMKKAKVLEADQNESDKLKKEVEIQGKYIDTSKNTYKKNLSSLSSTYIARRLLEMARENLDGDPFLRDGFTRGLERLGKPGIDAIVAALKSEDDKGVSAALYALQGWRSTDGLAALMAEATSSDTIPAEARVGLFKALRELGPAVPPESITEWLAAAPKADGVARAEAIRVVGAMQGRAAMAVAKVLPTLLADADAVVRRAALGLASEHRSEVVKTTLVALVSSPNRPADERSLALVALRGYEAKELTPLYLRAFDESKNSGLKGELLRTIAAGDFAAAAEKSEGLLGETDLNLRSIAIAILGQKPDTALIVAKRYNEGKLPGEDLPRVLESIRSHATPELQAATQTMLRSKLLAAPTGEDASKLRDYVTRRGNAGRGKLIYLDTTKGGCAACHKLEGSGTAIGPDLTKVYETLTFDKRVESILEPSKEIKEGYNTFKVATIDGRTLSGLLLSDTAEGVTLRDAQGKEVKVPVKEIDQKGPDTLSLMPAGVVGHLSFNELADLLSFLGDKRAQESLRAGGK